MVLATFSIKEFLLGFLFVSLAVLIIVIAYRKLLAYLGKGRVAPEDYCILYGLEEDPAQGTLEFYFTAKYPKDVTLELLDEKMEPILIIGERKAAKGGHIIRFDSNSVENGHYFYCLRTDNQKTMKKLIIKNQKVLVD